MMDCVDRILEKTLLIFLIWNDLCLRKQVIMTVTKPPIRLRDREHTVC